MRGRPFALLAVAGLLLPLGGCIPREIYQRNPLGALMRLLSGNISPYKAKVLSTVETTVDVDITASVGGLDGTYDITLDDPDGGTFGNFTGTATVKRGRFVSVKADEGEALFSAVAGIVGKALGGETVSLSKVKAKVTANQEPGGVAANFKAKISFDGDVLTGPNTGNRVKGKLEGEGNYPLEE